LTFYFLKDNIETSFIGNIDEKSKLISKISKTIEGIKKQHFLPTPSDYVCKHCDFRDICDYRN
jgi:radical SAM protein with 4Fe4S-binding SPASM domain